MCNVCENIGKVGSTTVNGHIARYSYKFPDPCIVFAYQWTTTVPLKNHQSITNGWPTYQALALHISLMFLSIFKCSTTDEMLILFWHSLCTLIWGCIRSQHTGSCLWCSHSSASCCYIYWLTTVSSSVPSAWSNRCCLKTKNQTLFLNKLSYCCALWDW